MSIDARTLTADATIETEICIVGGGPAGITLVRELTNQKFRVCLVESGGLEFDLNTQSLSAGQVTGNAYPPLTETRLRQLGGTANTWEAALDHNLLGWRSLPLDKSDFEQRDWIPYSGWPFTLADLDPFYRRAHEVCQLGSFTYSVEDWESDRASSLPFKSDRVFTSISQYGSRIPFTQDYPQEISRADNTTVLLHATITEIETDDAGRTVTRLKGSCWQGKKFWIKAKIFILAAGGIENARLLLLSNQKQSAGVGNQNDLVGRFFMEHPSIVCGLLKPARRQLFDQTALYDMRRVKDSFVVGELRLNQDLAQRESLLNSGIQLYPRPDESHQIAQRSLKSLFTSTHSTSLQKDILKHISKVATARNYFVKAAFWKAMRALPGLRRGVWTYLPYEKRRFSTFELVYQIEQAPDPSNRLLFSKEQDTFGQNKIDIHWKLNDIDLCTIKRVQEILKEEFSQSGLGELQVTDCLKYFKLAGHHHMGTTRMHADPKQGVVDSAGRVHEVNNLFITGSSVFPTSGYANPTLTIIALSIRMADHVKAVMQQESF